MSASRNSGKVLVSIVADQVNSLHEFSMLPSDAQFDHSIVFQVDSFWVLKSDVGSQNSSVLTNQYEYMFDEFDDDHRMYQDPFGLFKGEPLRGPHRLEPRQNNEAPEQMGSA